VEGLVDPRREGGRDIARLTGTALFARAAELSAAGRPFAVATVVAVRRPTSARPGAHGIVHPDGTIEGWVGGSCAQPVVVREALRSLADGEPRLLRISKETPSDSRRGAGIVEVVMTCHSGGTLEVYVEPQVAAPALWVVGTTPIAGALAALGAAAGFRTSVVDPVAEPAAFPGARVVTDASLASFERGTSPYVVVATQGVWDEEAVAAVLRRDASYVGLVASPTRAAVVREYLAEIGTPPEALAALRAPAGLDIGAQTAEEIALSILAELVQVRRGRAPFVAAPGPATVAGGGEQVTAGDAGVAAGRSDIVLLDPVCGMTVDERDARHLAEHDGIVYAFCSVGCRVRFMKNPAAYVPSGAPAAG
jgi:xanthine dehydrogenase accessory factor